MQASSRQNTATFCSAFLLSAFGYEFILFVMTVHVYAITKSALDVGVFVSLGFVPRLLSPCYGWIADRYDRTKVFAVAAGLMGISVFALSYANDVRWIYAAWFVISIFAMTIVNVRTTIMTEIMTRDHYLYGNSAVFIMLNMAKVLAPFLGGLVAVLWSPKLLLQLAAAIYLAVTALSAFLHLPEKTGMAQRNARTVLSDLQEGVMYILKDSSLRFLLAVAVCWRLFLGLQLSLFVVYVKSFLGLDSAAYGLFMTCIGLGSIAGSWMGPKIARRIDGSKWGLWGLGAHYLLFASLGLIRDFQAALIVAFSGFFIFYITLVGVHALRDRATRADVRGRVYGSITAVLTPFGIVSMVLGGYLAGIFGAEKIVVGSGLLAAASLSAIAAAFSRSKSLDVSLRLSAPQKRVT